jgi:hypothetical protein
MWQSKVRRIEASRIEEDRHVGVVIFKMNLSTGWDCPRAEVMMSFRRAETIHISLNYSEGWCEPHSRDVLNRTLL